MKVFIETLLIDCAPVTKNGTHLCPHTTCFMGEELGEFAAAEVPEGCHFPFLSPPSVSLHTSLFPVFYSASEGLPINEILTQGMGKHDRMSAAGQALLAQCIYTHCFRY